MLRVPVENLLAAFPVHVMAGSAELYPLTVGGAIVLGIYGVDFEREIRGETAILAGAVLSRAVSLADLADARRCGKCLMRFARRFRKQQAVLEDAVNLIVDKAFATRVPFLRTGGKVALSPSGLGWPLELAESLCHEYGWSWKDVLETPVATANALMAAAHQRLGGKFGGPDYIERIVIARRKKGGANG